MTLEQLAERVEGLVVEAPPFGFADPAAKRQTAYIDELRDCLAELIRAIAKDRT